jgi:hypothetical protein
VLLLLHHFARAVGFLHCGQMLQLGPLLLPALLLSFGQALLLLRQQYR